MDEGGGHVCDEACGITWDPGCPRWPTPEEASAELQRRSADEYLRDQAERLAQVLLELLREPISEIVRDVLAWRRGR